MKSQGVKKELERLGVKELEGQLDGLRRELFSLKLNAVTAHVKDYSQFKKLRKNIARAKTYLKNKKNAKLEA
jgi:ribosomal protein L29